MNKDADRIRRERILGGVREEDLRKPKRLCPLCGNEVVFEHVSMMLVCDECDELWLSSEVDRA